jgi:hypothetical protein
MCTFVPVKRVNWVKLVPRSGEAVGVEVEARALSEHAIKELRFNFLW